MALLKELFQAVTPWRAGGKAAAPAAPRASRPVKDKVPLTAAAQRRLGERYAKAAILQARYDSAMTTDENRNHWAGADALSPDAGLTVLTRRILRNRGRYECANNAYAGGMVNTLTLDTIGRGPTLDAFYGDEETNLACEWAFYRYARRIKLAEKLRTMRSAKARDGEIFAGLVTNPPLADPVKLDLRLYESEQVASSWSGGSQFDPRDGVIVDDYGNVIGYRLLRHHPGDVGYLHNWGPPETIPARDMIHYFHAPRAGQSRGIGEIAPALPLYAQLRRFTLAVLAAAESAADVAAFMESSSTAIDPSEEVEPLDAIEWEKRMLLTLPAGWKMSQLHAEQPATTYEMFVRCLLREIARCLSMPYNVAAGDSSSYNYSSGRLDHQTYYKAISIERSLIEDVILDVLFDRWWEEARLVAATNPVAYESRLRAALLSTPYAPRHEWRWDGDEHVDPSKEANATQVNLASGITHRALEYSRQGRDMEVEDQAAARGFGVSVEVYRQRLFDKAMGIVVQSNAPANGVAQDIADDDAADQAAEDRRQEANRAA